MQARIQKILSARGICSRRKAEEYIERGLVTVNGEVATIGQKADPDTDSIEVDGQVLSDRKEMLYYVMNKPVGVETTNSEHTAADSVRGLLPTDLQGVLYPVGRLDKDSSGLLLFTNDGVLAYRLTHPSFHHEKEYEVTVEHSITDGQLSKLEQGITISGEKTKSAKVQRLGKQQFCIALTEGRNRQIRRMCQKIGAPVTVLKRVRITTLQDPNLPEGQVRQLSKEEVKALLTSVEMENSSA